MVQDFKAAISKRETPLHLKVLSRMLILIILVTIALSATAFNFQIQFVAESENFGDQMMNLEYRKSQLI